MCVCALFTNTEVLYYDTTVKHNPSIVFINNRPFDTLKPCSSTLVHVPDVSLPQALLKAKNILSDFIYPSFVFLNLLMYFFFYFVLGLCNMALK